MSFIRQTITKMTDKMAKAYHFASIRCCGHSNLVIFNQISSKFYIWIASIKPWFKFELLYEFCLTNGNQDGRLNGCLSVCIHPLLCSLYRSHFYRISSKFHIKIASIKPWFMFEYEFCPSNDNQDGQQNVRRLSLCIHPLLWSLLLIGFLPNFCHHFMTYVIFFT